MWKTRQNRRLDVVHRPPLTRGMDKHRGYTLAELMVVVAIIIIAIAIAVPLVQNASRIYKMRSAVISVSGAIQRTRFQAISSGYPFRLVLTQATSTYQVQSNPCPPSNPPCWGNLGGTVPLSGSSVPATINQDTTLVFQPNGSVQATTGAPTLQLTYVGQQETITVTNYGSISLNPPM